MIMFIPNDYEYRSFVVALKKSNFILLRIVKLLADVNDDDIVYVLYISM